MNEIYIYEILAHLFWFFVIGFVINLSFSIYLLRKVNKLGKITNNSEDNTKKRADLQD